MEAAVSETLEITNSATYFLSIKEALSEAQHQPHPQLVLLCQQWPEEYTQAEATQFFATFPLSRLILCYSEWCRSDGRTRQVWPHAIRVACEDAPRRVQLEYEVIQGTTKGLPVTAGYEELFAFEES